MLQGFSGCLKGFLNFGLSDVKMRNINRDSVVSDLCSKLPSQKCLCRGCQTVLHGSGKCWNPRGLGIELLMLRGLENFGIRCRVCRLRVGM